MTYRPMKPSMYNPPATNYPSNLSFSTKTWPGPPSCMITRSTSRSRFNYRISIVHLTKTSPLYFTHPTTFYKYKSTDCYKFSLNTCGWLGGPKPNTIAENPCLLFDCTPRLNKYNSPVFYSFNTYSPFYIYCYDILNIPFI